MPLRAVFVPASLCALAACGGGDGGSTTQPFETLYCFGTSSTDALGPDGALIQGSDGNFYGTSSGGGIGGGPLDRTTGFYWGNGTVFKIAPTGEETVLHSFAGPPADGVNPHSLIEGSDGNFYGAAGVVFKLTPDGVETILYTSDVTGAGELVQGNDGNFYGTGGIGLRNMVFKLTPEGVLTTLHIFAGAPSDGSNPTGRLLQGSDGNFYGITNDGTTSTPGFGTVFKVTPDGIETILHFFSGPPADGAYPDALIQGSDGNFYGTTVEGGDEGVSDGWGTVFKLTPDGVETILHSFTGQGDGALPGGLVQGSDGNFYGVTVGGGAHNNGTIFKLTPTGVITAPYSFAFPGPNIPRSDLLRIA